MRLLLVRHGQTPHNVTGALDTAAPGAGLTPLGQAQAAAVPDALRDEDVSAVYASPLVRAQLTAAPLAQARGLGVQVVPGLEEVPAGDLELRSDAAAVQAYADCLLAWMCGDLDRAVPGGQDGHTLLARYDAALGGIAAANAPTSTVVAVVHGAAMRVWTAVRTGTDPALSSTLWVANTGCAVLEGGPDEGWRLLRWHPEPLGAAGLDDPAAPDPTGASPRGVHEGTPGG
ncbi:histidine phosphatase family protein [Kineococcus sp. NUM-3379]